MKILSVEQLAIPEIKVVKFARFRDERGYFTEHFRKSQLLGGEETPFMEGVEFVQANESFSRAGVVRGLHFQWDPFMGKLVRTLRGHMIDIVLDIRKGSPTLGKAIVHDMPSTGGEDSDAWIWVPPGFAHGNAFLEDTLIEYFCSGQYSPGNEAGISPLAEDIDWSLCDDTLRQEFYRISTTTDLMTEKDRDGLSLSAWQEDERSANFVYGSTGGE